MPQLLWPKIKTSPQNLELGGSGNALNILDSLRGLIFFQIWVQMEAIDARRCWCWLYFHTGVTVLSMVPARIEETVLEAVLLMRTCLANALIVSLPSISWLPRVDLGIAIGLPVTLLVFSTITILSLVAVFFFSSSVRCRRNNCAFAIFRGPSRNTSSGLVPRVSPVLVSIRCCVVGAGCTSTRV